jgi:tetratricopeptide (TPR) repeat protein
MAGTSAPASDSGPTLVGFRSGRSRARLWAALLAAAVLACYANTLRVPFLYDDTLAIPENPTIRRWWRLDEVLRPQREGGLTVSGRPVLNLSFAVNYALSGENPWSYHAVNALLHAGSALLLAGIVRRTLRPAAAGGAAKGAVSAADADRVALLAAALWALHPLLTQAVTYTVQRAESLMGFFYLFTLYAFVRGADAEEPRSARWRSASIAACALGMATKEVMASAPLLVLLFDRTFLAGSFGAAWRARGKQHLLLAATWLVLLGLVASTGGNRGGTVGLGVGVPLWAYPLTQFQAVARYLGLAVWPHPLVFEYGSFWVARASDILPYAAIVLALLAVTAVALRRWPRAGFLGAWYFLILAPSSLTPGTIQMIVEHRAYLSTAALAVAAALGLSRVGGRRGLRVGAALVPALGALTLARNHDYRTALALWSDNVAKRPLNPRGHDAFASACEARGDLDAALRARAEAVRLLPDEAHYHYNLGATLAKAGRFTEAARSYEMALRLAPREARTHNNLAVTLVQLGDLAAALPHYAEAIRLQPQDAQFRYNQAIAFLRLGRPADAAPAFAAALALEPAHADAHFNLGNAFAQLGRKAEAAQEFASAARLRPDDADAHFKLANMLLDLDRVAEAVGHYQAAVRLRPEDAEAHHNLGIAHARLEQWPEAEREFATALRLKPDYREAEANLARLRALLRR